MTRHALLLAVALALGCSDDSVGYDVGGVKGTIKDSDPVCGNVHFAPNGRQHYDLTSPHTVSTSCEGYRQGRGPGGKDAKRPFSTAKISGYKSIANDCMGAFLVYWWQNIPGWGNKATGADAKPMLSWLPFIYY